jgi:hypothetical protein
MDVYLVLQMVEVMAVKMVEQLVGCLEAMLVELWVVKMVDVTVG